MPPPVPAASDAASGVTRLAHPGPIAGGGAPEQLWPMPRIEVGPTGAPVTWTPAGAVGSGGAVVFTSEVAPSPGAAPVGVAWIDQAHAVVQLFAGTTQPGGSFRYQGMVPPSLVTNLVAAFEGGFQFAVSNGGFEQDGVVGAPLVEGAASLVELTNGRVEIGAWGSEVGPSPAVSAVRQNLTLLVDHGAVLPTASENPLVTWGYSLGNLLATWRSGLGITSHGNLVWVGGPGLSPATLGSMLVWAGAVRGMQLDINPYWVSFATFAEGPNGLVATNLLPSMAQAPTHYLVPFWRDFVAVFLAEPGSP
ncbi:hypothetical protein [Acidimicrobium ferrooxidans]|uniref:hypothetical protein n=1 Tax=Acidimicrobium ferrooxidans TaxID=53635 RepID=UPI001495064A|nr:hypothetical protein [Acidimicrobium ferrooxidans]